MIITFPRFCFWPLRTEKQDGGDEPVHPEERTTVRDSYSCTVAVFLLFFVGFVTKMDRDETRVGSIRAGTEKVEGLEEESRDSGELAKLI